MYWRVKYYVKHTDYYVSYRLMWYLYLLGNMRNFEVVSEKFNVPWNTVVGSYEQKLVTQLLGY